MKFLLTVLLTLSAFSMESSEKDGRFRVTCERMVQGAGLTEQERKDFDLAIVGEFDKLINQAYTDLDQKSNNFSALEKALELIPRGTTILSYLYERKEIKTDPKTKNMLLEKMRAFDKKKDAKGTVELLQSLINGDFNEQILTNKITEIETFWKKNLKMNPARQEDIEACKKAIDLGRFKVAEAYIESLQYAGKNYSSLDLSKKFKGNIPND